MIKKIKKKMKIVVIYNKYKSTFNDLINSLNTKFLKQLKSLNWLRLINKRIQNAYRFKNTLLGFLKKDYLDKDFLVILLGLTPKF